MILPAAIYMQAKPIKSLIYSNLHFTYNDQSNQDRWQCG